MPTEPLRTILEAHLQPVLVRAGFAEGQWAGEHDATSVIFCAAGSDYVRRHPELVGKGEHWDDVYCMDITIEGSVRGGITRFDVEYEALGELLARTGRLAELQRLPALLGLKQPDRDGRSLAGILSRLYGDAHG